MKPARLLLGNRLLELPSGGDRPWLEHPTESVLADSFGEDGPWFDVGVGRPDNRFIVSWREEPVPVSEWLEAPTRSADWEPAPSRPVVVQMSGGAALGRARLRRMESQPCERAKPHQRS